MGARLHFLGVGSSHTRGVLSEGGFLVLGDRSVVLVDPGPGAAQALAQLKIASVDAVLVSQKERAHDADLVEVKKEPSDEFSIERDEGMFRIRLPEGVIGYVFDRHKRRDDVDVLVVREECVKVLERSRPKLAVLTGFSSADGQLYHARELQKRLGVQTIAATDGLVVDLVAYGALAEQKTLKGFLKK